MYFNNFSILMIDDMGKKGLITTIDHNTSTTWGLSSITLMINVVGQIRSYHNNWSSHIKHIRTYYNTWSSHIKHKRTIAQMLSQQLIITNQTQKDNCQIKIWFYDIVQNRSYHNKWSPYIDHKRTIIKFTNH